MIGLALAAALMGAQPEVDCSDPQDQASMNICAHRSYREADAQLNRVWPLTLARVQQLDRDSAGVTPAGEAERRLRAAQRAWIAFRDAQCQVAGLEALGGSMEQLLVGSCLAELTNRRMEELMMLLAGAN